MSNFTVKIRDFTLLMGKNGTGKSAIFEVINCLHRFICQKVDITHIFPTFTLSKFMTHSDQTFELEVSDDDGEFRYVYKLIIEHERAAEKARVKKEELLLNDQPILKIEMGEAHMFSEETPHHEYREGPTFPFNWSISGFTLEFKEEFNSSLLLFRKWAQGIVALSPNPWQIKPSSISESVFLDSHAENFASWYRNNLLTNYQNISEKVDTRIQQILPGYNGLHFHGTGGEWNRFCSWF